MKLHQLVKAPAEQAEAVFNVKFLVGWMLTPQCGNPEVGLADGADEFSMYMMGGEL